MSNPTTASQAGWFKEAIFAALAFFAMLLIPCMSYLYARRQRKRQVGAILPMHRRFKGKRTVCTSEKSNQDTEPSSAKPEPFQVLRDQSTSETTEDSQWLAKLESCEIRIVQGLVRKVTLVGR